MFMALMLPTALLIQSLYFGSQISQNIFLLNAPEHFKICFYFLTGWFSKFKENFVALGKIYYCCRKQYSKNVKISGPWKYILNLIREAEEKKYSPYNPRD